MPQNKPPTLVKLISWNVNGIRSVLKKGFLEFFETEKADIFCVQEIKATPADVHLQLPGYEQYWNSAVKKGYAGTALFTKSKPLKVTNGLGIAKHDQEGRVITAEYPKFFLVNVYTPNSKRGLERLEYRQKEWDVDFLKYLKNLERKKPVIFCGDLNVAHQEIDLTYPKANRFNHGFTDEEREGFRKLLKAKYIDSFREFCQEGGHYTWWSQMHRARPRNIGWRIDYFCISPRLRPYLKKADILPDVMGSDHCPVRMILEL